MKPREIQRHFGLTEEEYKVYEETLHRMLELLLEMGVDISVDKILKATHTSGEKQSSNKKFVKGVLRKKRNFYIYNHFKKRFIND